MARKYILVTILFNGGPFTLFDFIVQCYEYYRDDVLRWDGRVGKDSDVWFKNYKDIFGGFNIELYRLFRNLYVHDFDEKCWQILYNLPRVTPEVILEACEFYDIVDDFGIERDFIVDIIERATGAVQSIRTFELNGVE